MKREYKICFWLMAIICCCLCLTACERIYLSEEESYLTAEINSKEYKWKKINPFQESAGHSEYKFKLRMLGVGEAYVSYHDMSGQFHLEYYAVED